MPKNLAGNITYMYMYLHTCDFPIKEMVEKLMTNTVKDEECMLPGIHPPEREQPLSSIFVEAELSSSVTNTFHFFI